MASWLIVGASSFYGRSFGAYLEARGEKVIPASLRDMKSCEVDANYVVNFAAANLVAESWDCPASYMQVNGVRFTYLLDRLRLRSFIRYVHVSTPEVYGDMTSPRDERCAFSPSTPYAVSRAAGDMMLRAYGRAYDLPYVITRTANVYGPQQQPYRLIPKAFEMVRAGKPFPLDGGGNTLRSYIHVRDACEATYLIATKGRTYSTYHIATETLHSVKEVVEMVGRVLAMPVAFEDVPERLGKDLCYQMDSSKLRRLGWSDAVRLEDGLRNYMEATSENSAAETR